MFMVYCDVILCILALQIVSKFTGLNIYVVPQRWQFPAEMFRSGMISHVCIWICKMLACKMNYNFYASPSLASGRQKYSSNRIPDSVCSGCKLHVYTYTAACAVHTCHTHLARTNYSFQLVMYVCVCVCVRSTCLCKGRAIPLQALTGPEGSRRLRLPDFKTIGTWRLSALHTSHPRKYSWYSFLLEAESTPGP
jgi:hypothetical protein